MRFVSLCAWYPWWLLFLLTILVQSQGRVEDSHFFLPNGGMGFPSNDGCIWSMLIADENTGLYAMKRLCKLSNSTWRGCNGSMASSGWFLSLEIISQTMFFCLLNMCIGLFSVPRLMCAEMIHECLVGYAARTGWNSTDSIFSPCAKMCRRRNLK